ncbi:MAG: hypothetical protein AB7D51_11605 [Desulfovibrionaceae bacterium]
MPKSAPRIVHTAYGPIPALKAVTLHASGAVRACVAASACTLESPVGPLVPQFTANTLRKRRLPEIALHENGVPRILPLEEQTVVTTPLGPMPAELVAFHHTGELRRVFPLNGALSGFWSQEDEAALAAPMPLATPAGEIAARIIGVHFSPSGALRSLTLWPGECATLPTPAGLLCVRIGMAFHDDGSLRSVEPASPVPVHTPLGELAAFDPDAVGISGDANSLRFGPGGRVDGLTTIRHGFDIEEPGGAPRRVDPPLRKSYCDGETPEIVPLELDFQDARVVIRAEGRLLAEAPLGSVRAHGFLPPLPRLVPACGLDSRPL